MKNGKTILIIFCMIMLSGLVMSAQGTLGFRKAGECMSLPQTCASCTFNNITTIVRPTGEIDSIYSTMTRTGSDYNYSYCNTSTVGGYIINGIGDIGGELTVWVYDVEVTVTGEETDTSDAIFYFLSVSFVLILFLIVLYVNIKIPSKSRKNEKGEIIFLTKWKYLKIGMILITYALFVWLLNLFVGLSNNFIGLSMYAGLFDFLFGVFIRLSYIVFIIVFVLFGYNWIRDINISREIKKFGSAVR